MGLFQQARELVKNVLLVTPKIELLLDDRIAGLAMARHALYLKLQALSECEQSSRPNIVYRDVFHVTSK
jgi:hypothetical protein